MNKAQQLVDEIRDLQAQAAGKQAELAMLLGERDEAIRYTSEMNAITRARIASKFAQAEERGECYFVTAGDVGGMGAA